jgi:c-di-GMP-binding flagellar brake protein YcgR
VVEDNGRRNSIQGKTLDISSDGTSFVSSFNIQLGHEGNLFLMLNPGDAKNPPVVLETQCKVISCVLSPQQGGFRLGLHFTKMSAENKQVLQKFLVPLMAHARETAH